MHRRFVGVQQFLPKTWSSKVGTRIRNDRCNGKRPKHQSKRTSASCCRAAETLAGRCEIRLFKSLYHSIRCSREHTQLPNKGIQLVTNKNPMKPSNVSAEQDCRPLSTSAGILFPNRFLLQTLKDTIQQARGSVYLSTRSLASTIPCRELCNPIDRTIQQDQEGMYSG